MSNANENIILQMIRDLTVFIENSNSNKGTGFILRQTAQDKFAYIFTARHVVMGVGYEHGTINPENFFTVLVENSIKISLKSKNIEQLKIWDNKFYHPKNFDDFGFFIVNLDDNKISDIEITTISEYVIAADKSYDFYSFGYPRIADTSQNNTGEDFKLENPNKIIQSKLIEQDRELEVEEIIKFKAKNLYAGLTNGKPTISTILSGLSGAGVFYSDTNKLYVTAIIIKSSSINSIQAVDLYKQVDNINEILISLESTDQLPKLTGNTFFSFGKNLIDLEKLDCQKLLQDLISVDPSQLESFRKNSNIINAKKKIEQQTNTLAQYCAHLGVEYNNIKKYDRARTYFKHAIDLDKRYSQLFLLVKNERRTSKENEQIILVSDDIINNPNSSWARRYEALVKKINILYEEGKTQDEYLAIFDLFKIARMLFATGPANQDTQGYIQRAKDLLNLETEELLKQDGFIDIAKYLDISDLSFANKHINEALYFLYCAKELAKICIPKQDIPELLGEINNRIQEIVSHSNDIERSLIFKAQTDAEEIGRNLEKIKDQSDMQIYSDVKTILSKLNDIYDRSNNTGILKEIEENIRYISSKFSETNSNPQPPSNEKKSISKSAIHSFLIDIFLFIGTVILVSGSSSTNI